MTLDALASTVVDRVVRSRDGSREPSTAAHLVGFSLGALVAQKIALEWPGFVRSLIIVSGVGGQNRAERRAMMRGERAARDHSSGGIEAALEFYTGGDAGRLPTELAWYVRRTLATRDVETFVDAFRLLADGGRDLWPRLDDIRAPTLVMTGADDTIATPRMARAIAQAVPSGETRVFDDAHHLLPLERPRAVADQIVAHIAGREGATADELEPVSARVRVRRATRAASPPQS